MFRDVPCSGFHVPEPFFFSCSPSFVDPFAPDVHQGFFKLSDEKHKRSFTGKLGTKTTDSV